MNESTKGRYDKILGRYLLTVLILNLKLSYNVIKAYDGPFKGYTEPMIDMGTYEYKNLNIGMIAPVEFFMNACAEEIN